MWVKLKLVYKISPQYNENTTISLNNIGPKAHRHTVFKQAHKDTHIMAHLHTCHHSIDFIYVYIYDKILSRGGIFTIYHE